MASPKGGASYAATADADAQRIRTRVLPKMHGEADYLLALLVDIEEVVRIYKDLAGDITALAIAALPPLKRDQAYEVEGLGSFTPKPGYSSKKYDNPALISQLAARLSDFYGVADEDGEPGMDKLVALFADMVGAGTASFNSWRMNPLRAIGVDPATYVLEQTQGKPTLQKRLVDNPSTVKETK